MKSSESITQVVVETSSKSSESPKEPPNAPSQTSPKSTPTKGIGKGFKYCKKCNGKIGARSATCSLCGYVYPFKGKKHVKPTKPSPKTIMVSPKTQYKHDDVPETPQEEKSPDKPTIQANYSSFMTHKPNFVDIEPKEKPQLTTESIDSYINESQLLLNCAYEQVANLGDLESATKILDRATTNLTYLATLCDASGDHPDNIGFLNL